MRSLVTKLNIILVKFLTSEPTAKEEYKNQQHTPYS